MSIDLDQAPYAAYGAKLAELRRAPESWSALACSPRQTEHGTSDGNELERWRMAHVLLITATAADVELLRFLLDEEIRARETDSYQGAGDTLSILSMLVLTYGDLGDVTRFWRAKFANFDTAAGGYDLQMVFAVAPPDEVLAHLRAHFGAEVDENLEDYELDQLLSSPPGWRSHLERRYPRTLVGLSAARYAAWAQLFGDDERALEFALSAAETPSERALAYRDAGRFDQALPYLLEAVQATESEWERASGLHSVLDCAARASAIEAGLRAALELDRLRPAIESWAEVGLGRMATQSCYELAAAAQEAEHGRQLWALAERWRQGLDTFYLKGLESAERAAQRWGSATEQRAVQRALAAEQRRIERARR